jgi:hypothetical protein
MFLGVASLEKEADISSWLTSYKDGAVENREAIEKYVFAFYWSATTMTTVYYLHYL